MVKACHPEPTVVVTTAVTAFAVAAGRGVGAIWVAAAVLAGQLSVGWSNDYLDRHRDRRNRRRDKPIVANEVPERVVLAGAMVAAIACIPLSLVSGWRAGGVHLLGVCGAWAYNGWLKRTVLSPLPYLVGFSALPAFVVLGLPGAPTPPAWLLVAGALLGGGAHFANVLPDLADDLRTGVRGLPHRLGYAGTSAAAAGLLVAASVVLALGPSDPGVLDALASVGAAALLALGLAAARRRPGSRVLFRVTLAIGAIDVALLVAGGAAIT